MNHGERAENISAAWYSDDGIPEGLSWAITQALVAVERETLERAALEAEDFGGSAGRLIAKDIRQSIQVTQDSGAVSAAEPGLAGVNGAETTSAPALSTSKVCSLGVSGCSLDSIRPSKQSSKESEIDRAVREGRTETFTRPFPKPSETTQTVVAVCERCEDYDKILEQYAESAGKTINQLRKALKEARETAPAVTATECLQRLEDRELVRRATVIMKMLTKGCGDIERKHDCEIYGHKEALEWLAATTPKDFSPGDKNG
jgi:hypothetical protein